MALSGPEKKIIREVLAQAFSRSDLSRLVSDADLPTSLEKLSGASTEYIEDVRRLVDSAVSQGQLVKLLEAAVETAPANGELRDALEIARRAARASADLDGPGEAREREKLLRAYLAGVAEKFAPFNQKWPPAAKASRDENFARLIRGQVPAGLPLLVQEEPPAPGEGRPLADLLEPGARLAVVAEYPDGLTPVLHRALVELARDTDVTDPSRHLPIICSDYWGVHGGLWESGPNDDDKQRIRKVQDERIAAGRAVVFFDGWDASVMGPVLERAAAHPENIVVVGAAPGTFALTGYRSLKIRSLGREAQQEIARTWLEEPDAASLLATVEKSPALAAAARAPYSFTVMCIAERLRLEEAAAWTGKRPAFVPAQMMDALLSAMWLHADLPGRLRSRSLVGSSAELTTYAREVMLLFQKGESCVRREAAGAQRPGAGVGASNFDKIADATGMFVRSSRDGAPVLEPLHPALWDALAARGLRYSVDRYTGPAAKEIDERLVSLLARAADLLRCDLQAEDVLDTECGNWLLSITDNNHALGLATIARSVVVPNAGLAKLLGLRPLPDKWSGYRPDRWRALESKLRIVESMPNLAREDADVFRLFRRLAQAGSSFDLAMIRRSLHRMQRRYAREGRPPPSGFDELWNVESFFALAGRPCRPDTIPPDDWIPIPQGEDVMIGAGDQDASAWDNERPWFRVNVPSFEMARIPVLNAQLQAFDPSWGGQQEAEAAPLSGNWAELPATRVSWYEAWIFAEWMQASLPSEIQWERACWGKRASFRDDVPYWFKNKEQFDRSVWFRGNSNIGGSPGPQPPRRHPGSQLGLEARPFGLHDILGNVWEWCEDDQGYEYKAGPTIEYTGPFRAHTDSGTSLVNRVIRGGSWDSEKEDCRCSARQFAYPAVRSDVIGFRLVRNTASGGSR